MNSPAMQRDALMPSRPEGMGRGLILAIIAHALLLIGLALNVNWRSSDPPAMEAELWAAVPQVAAPRYVPPPETPPEPVQPKPVPKADTPPPKPVPDAQIAIEKARKEKLKEEKELKELRELEKKELERKLLERKELEKKELLKREQADKLRDEKKEADRKKKESDARASSEAEARRAEQLKRILNQAGAPNGSNGTAERNAGPSGNYGGRVKAAIYPNITFVRELEGNPLVDVEVRTAPDGVIMSRRIIKGSGIKEWDDAVLDAIDKTARLPRDGDKPPPSVMTIGFKPHDR